MKYYISFPIFFDCDLRCYYCFSADSMSTNMPPVRLVTPVHYVRFRDAFLVDAEEIVIELNGGETFLPINVAAVTSFIKQTDRERIELQTNGIQEEDRYRSMLPYRDRILRIGFTYHRRLINSVPSLRAAYERNVIMMRDLGFHVYVKEILFAGESEEIAGNRERWNGLGVEFKVQDFKGSSLGMSAEETPRYNANDWKMISAEYLRDPYDCRCKPGYKQLLVMRDGRVLACYVYQEPVGNMVECTYKPGYHVSMLERRVAWD
jgi:MoaA/NifB/PqqE/SkfB family radical SAM enzyme